MDAKKLRVIAVPKSMVRSDGPAPYRAYFNRVSTQGVKALFVLAQSLTTRTEALRSFEMNCEANCEEP